MQTYDIADMMENHKIKVGWEDGKKQEKRNPETRGSHRMGVFSWEGGYCGLELSERLLVERVPD